MGEIADRVFGKDPVVTKGKLKTTFRKVTGSKKIDREVARNNMKKAGYKQICKDKGGGSFFANNWELFVG
jgi:hypothetical protein